MPANTLTFSMHICNATAPGCFHRKLQPRIVNMRCSLFEGSRLATVCHHRRVWEPTSSRASAVSSCGCCHGRGVWHRARSAAALDNAKQRLERCCWYASVMLSPQEARCSCQQALQQVGATNTIKLPAELHQESAGSLQSLCSTNRVPPDGSSGVHLQQLLERPQPLYRREHRRRQHRSLRTALQPFHRLNNFLD